MNTTETNIRGNGFAKKLPLSVHFSRRYNFVFPIRIAQGERHCPSCNSIVYSRRHRLCGVCGQVLPEICLFTAVQAQDVEMLVRTERQRHRAWLKKKAAR